ncbi:MAG: oligoendopeptidase F [Atribacterota bacterium]|nr:oligoendopeptidase F [Atribacterota bacterium]
MYQHHLQGIFRKKKHILSPEKEKIIAQAGEMSMIPENTFGLLSNADLKFPSVKNHNGEYIAISQGNFVSLLRNKDRNFRKRVFRKYYQQYFLHRHTFASLLTGKLKKDRFFNKVRKYKNSLSAALFEDNIPIAVYDNLINIAHKNVSLLQKYIQLKKERLGYKNFYMYDMYTALSEKTDRIEYSKAQELILAALQPLGSEYLEIVKKAFKERWIDVYENKGKSSGAYSTGSYKSKPYILLNYQGTMEDVFTLAHELGHSLHSFYTNKEQPFIYSGYPIFLAEIASTTNEALLINYIIKNNAESKKDTLLILNNFLEQFRTTFFRQTMFAEFEKIIHQYEEKGGSLTAEWYSQQYADLIYKYYGNSVVIDKEIHMEWARIPHFYYDFYVYKYSTGFASAIALSRRILQEGKTAVDEYLRFLGKGSSEYPITILKQTGVDMISLNPLTEAMNLFAELLEQLESI